MKKMKVFKYVLLTAFLIVGVFVAVAGYQLYDRMCWFGIEDGIAHGYEGLVFWIKEYVKENKKPPEILSDAPDWAEDIQRMKDIVKIDYEVMKTDYYVIPERNAWKLDVLVRARGKERQFIYVSDGKLTPDEESRYYVWCHDWIVLKKD